MLQIYEIWGGDRWIFTKSTTSSNSTLLTEKNLGENLDLIGIRVTAPGKFSVVYYKDGQRMRYNVDFGSDETMP